MDKTVFFYRFIHNSKNSTEICSSSYIDEMELNYIDPVGKEVDYQNNENLTESHIFQLPQQIQIHSYLSVKSLTT